MKRHFAAFLVVLAVTTSAPAQNGTGNPDFNPDGSETILRQCRVDPRRCAEPPSTENPAGDAIELFRRANPKADKAFGLALRCAFLNQDCDKVDDPL